MVTLQELQARHSPEKQARIRAFAEELLKTFEANHATYVNARKALEAAEKERRRETRPNERERDPEEDVAPARAVDAGGLLEFDEARRGERRLKRTHDER